MENLHGLAVRTCQVRLCRPFLSPTASKSRGLDSFCPLCWRQCRWIGCLHPVLSLTGGGSPGPPSGFSNCKPGQIPGNILNFGVWEHVQDTLRDVGLRRHLTFRRGSPHTLAAPLPEGSNKKTRGKSPDPSVTRMRGDTPVLGTGTNGATPSRPRPSPQEAAGGLINPQQKLHRYFSIN